MPAMAFPSTVAPALPTVVVEPPDGWVPTVYPGALLASLAPRPDGEFRPNFIVTATRHEPGYTLAEAAASLREELESLPEAALKEVSESTEISVAQAVAFVDEEAGTVLQVHVLVLVDQAVCVDLVHLTASCSGATVAEDEPALDKIVSSLSVGLLGGEA